MAKRIKTEPEPSFREVVTPQGEPSLPPFQPKVEHDDPVRPTDPDDILATEVNQSTGQTAPKRNADDSYFITLRGASVFLMVKEQTNEVHLLKWKNLPGKAMQRKGK